MTIDKNTKIYLGQTEIVKIKKGNVVIWEKGPTGPDYFYVENTYAGTNTISLKDNQSIILMRELQYSKDKETWTTFTPSSTALNISLNQGEKLYIRGSGNKGGARLKISGSQAHIVGGNINTLIKYDDPNNVTLSTNAFNDLFSGDTKLTSASNLTLPATTLTNYCYGGMFEYCHSLTSVPALPATTLATGCYQSMFYFCISLVNAPVLPATDIRNICYRLMFNNCTSLTTAPALPATTLAQGCYEGMFGGCQALTVAPALPATTLADGCYKSMFNGCTSLNYIKCLATDDSSYSNDFRDCCESWVDGVSSSGTFIASDYYSQGWYWGSSGVPENWTTQTESGNPFEPSGGGTWSVESTGTYPFQLNSNDYYESTNKGQDNTYSYATLNYSGFDSLVLECINFAESSFDYGIISQPDVQLSESITDDGETGSDNVFHNFKGEQSENPVQLTIPSDGAEHFITIKFIKDTSMGENNDSLQFKVVEP